LTSALRFDKLVKSPKMQNEQSPPNDFADIDQMMVEVAEAPKGEGELTRLRGIADQITALEAEIAEDEDLLKGKQKRLFLLQTKTLPEAMAEVGMLEFKLLDGNEVKVSKRYFANISEERLAAAHAWLREHDHGDLIKNQFVLAFGAGEDATATELRDHLSGKGFTFDEKTAVNANTLKAFVKEQMEAEETAVTFPREVFGAFVQDVAEISAPKKKKAGGKKK